MVEGCTEAFRNGIIPYDLWESLTRPSFLFVRDRKNLIVFNNLPIDMLREIRRRISTVNAVVAEQL